MDWNKAKTHLDAVYEKYTGQLGKTEDLHPIAAIKFTLNPILKRYEDGERSEQLYDVMIHLDEVRHAG